MGFEEATVILCGYENLYIGLEYNCAAYQLQIQHICILWVAMGSQIFKCTILFPRQVKSLPRS